MKRKSLTSHRWMKPILVKQAFEVVPRLRKWRPNSIPCVCTLLLLLSWCGLDDGWQNLSESASLQTPATNSSYRSSDEKWDLREYRDREVQVFRVSEHQVQKEQTFDREDQYRADWALKVQFREGRVQDNGVLEHIPHPSPKTESGMTKQWPSPRCYWKIPFGKI